MPRIEVLSASPEEASNGITEFWCGSELMAFTIFDDGQLQLRIEPRADGSPWLIETASLAEGLAKAARQIAAY
jgi:hypothetical protein